MPMRTKVHITVTFVTMKPGSKPTILIDNPINLSEHVGSISSYNKLLDAIDDLVEDNAHDLFFHKDPCHKFSFDGSTIQNSAIYGRHEKRSDIDSGRATLQNLIPIQFDLSFKGNIAAAGIEVYKKRSVSRKGRLSKVFRKSKDRVVEFVLLEFCVVLLKEKLTAPKIITLPLLVSGDLPTELIEKGSLQTPLFLSFKSPGKKL